jgi:hypothetical protein
MKKYSELIRKQIKIIGALNTLFYIADVKNIKEDDIKKLFKIAEKTNCEYMLIYAMREGVTGKKYRYSEIGRILGKKRCVIRKKYQRCKSLIGGIT